jgi:hypothetical protein
MAKWILSLVSNICSYIPCQHNQSNPGDSDVPA